MKLELKMKKKLLIFILSIFCITGAALANGMVFDPTEYPTIEEIPVSKVNSNSTNALTNSAAQLPSSSAIDENIKASSTLSQDAVSGQNGNFNNALFELDSAQVNIRNELLDLRAKYQEVDTQYQLIKEQRRVLNQQVKSIERRIKGIEKTKANIRKNMI